MKKFITFIIPMIGCVTIGGLAAIFTGDMPYMNHWVGFPVTLLCGYLYRECGK